MKIPNKHIIYITCGIANTEKQIVVFFVNEVYFPTHPQLQIFLKEINNKTVKL